MSKGLTITGSSFCCAIVTCTCEFQHEIAVDEDLIIRKTTLLCTCKYCVTGAVRALHINRVVVRSGTIMSDRACTINTTIAPTAPITQNRKTTYKNDKRIYIIFIIIILYCKCKHDTNSK